MAASSPVARTLEVEVQMQDAALVRALEAAPVRRLPLLVDDPEGDVLVGGPGREDQDARLARP